MVHPATALFPMMNDAELKELAEDIKHHGLQQPVVLNVDESILIDGRNRLRACELAGESGGDYLVTTALPDYTEQQIIDYIVSANLHRRHLTAGQKATLAAELEPMYAEAQRIGRPPKGEEKTVANSPPFSEQERKSREQAAKATGSSGRSVSDAKALKKEAPDLYERVSTGDMTLNAATKERQARKKGKAQPPEPDGAPDTPADTPWKWKNPELHEALDAGAKVPELKERFGISDTTIGEARRYLEGHAAGRDELPPAWDTIPGNQREKLEKAKASIRRQLEREFRTRLLAEMDQYRAQCDANVAAYKAQLDEQDRKIRASRDEERARYNRYIEVARTKGLITPDEYALIRSCLHPDSRQSVTDQKLAAAFRVFNDLRIKTLLVKEV
jgi:ParB-like chromosome segregation protein Spo0J